MRLIIGLVAIMILLMAGGCSDHDSDTGSVSKYLKVESVSSANDVKAGSTLSVTVDISSGESLSDVPLVVSGVKSDDTNSSVYFDTATIASLESGDHNYVIDITVPRDLLLGEYMLIVDVDPDDLLGDWADTDQFRESDANITVLAHGPDDVLVSGGLDSDDSEASQAAALTPAGTVTITATDENISIDATLSLYPNLAELNATDVNVTACVHVGSECIDLPLWSSEGNGTLSDVLQLHDLEYGYETLVAVDTVLPYTEIATIINEIKNQILANPFGSTLLDSSLDVTLSYNGQQKLYAVNMQFALSSELLASVLAPSPARTSAMKAPAQSSGNCAPKLLDYEKVFKRHKYGKRFGAGAYLKGSAGLDGDGIHSKVYGSVTAKALGRKDNFMRLHFNADALPGSFEGTGYDLDVEVLGIVVYTKSNSLADVSGLSTPEITSSEEAAIQLKIDNNETNLSKATLIKQKIYKKANNSISTYSGSGSTAIGYVEEWSVGKKKGYTQQFIVGIVPVKITAGAQATVGYAADIHLNGITSVTGSFKPKADMGAYVQGGVGVVGYSAGVEADLWLLKESLNNTVTASLDFVEDADQEYIVSINGDLHEKIYNYFRGPNGKLYLYAEYTVPKYCKRFGVRYICGAKTKTKRKYLGKWKTSSSKATILDKEQTLFTIPLDDCN